MRIGITFNLKSDIHTAVIPAQAGIQRLDPRFRGGDKVYEGPSELPEDIAEEYDLPETIEAIEKVLSGEGYEVHRLGGDLGIMEQIKHFRIDFVFNIVEGFQGRNREAHIPALLELLGVPYSGSDPLGLAVTLDKSLTKRIAMSLGISTPEFWILNDKADVSTVPNQFPFFVKPLWEGSSKGIRLTSRIKNRSELEAETNRLWRDYREVPILVERYVPGREFAVGVIGNDPPQVLGVMEIMFRDPKKDDFCYSFEVKRNWKELVQYHLPPAIDAQKTEEFEKSALMLFKVLRLRDIARFDFRMDPQGKIYFLEVNPLPGLSPESGDIVIMSKKKGLSYRDLILKIFNSALGRYPTLSHAKVEGDIK